MRKYETTHPWITFQLNMALHPKIWMALGEAQSKCEHIAGIPLKPEVALRLHQLFLARGALATTAIEGNTLSEEDALKQIEGKLELPESKEYMARAIQNIVDACNEIANKLICGEQLRLNVNDIKKYNKIVLKKLPLEDGVTPGELNTKPVGITGARYRGAPPEDCEYLLTRLCDWLNDGLEKPDKESVIATGIVKAIVAHVYLVWIHPFGDGNGRTARLVELQILLDSCIPTPAAHLLSNFYNETRDEYYRQLSKSSKSGGNLTSFIEYAVKGFVQQLKTQISTIRNEQWEVAWKDYVYEFFRGKNKASDRRKRDLVIELSKIDRPVSIAKMKETSPNIALLYVNKTFQTFFNDVIDLQKLGLLQKHEAGFKANKEKILSFLPPRREVES